MYNKFFSEQWIFDRCLEGQRFFIPLNVIVFLSVSLLLFFLIKKSEFLIKKQIFITICVGIIIAPLVFLLSSLFGIFSCSYGAFWKGINPANELYSKVKYNCKNGNCPKTEKELSQLDPSLYKGIIDNAKSKYVYNVKTGKYLWFVRPSNYLMAVFEGNGFGVFEVSTYPGSKENIPK